MSQEDKGSRIKRLTSKQWTALALGVVALIFILQNLNYVRVELLIFHTSAPLWAVLLITVVAGYLIGRFSQRK